jgi:hypothetical protein
MLPVAWTGASLATAVLLVVVRPDGHLHVDQLTVDRGQAVFVRDPAGRAALVVRGRPDAVSLANQVAEHLAVWEHKLDVVVVADANASRAVALTLARYPADRLIQLATPQSRVDVGSGVLIDLRSGPTTSAARPGSAN